MTRVLTTPCFCFFVVVDDAPRCLVSACVPAMIDRWAASRERTPGRIVGRVLDATPLVIGQPQTRARKEDPLTGSHGNSTAAAALPRPILPSNQPAVMSVIKYGHLNAKPFARRRVLSHSSSWSRVFHFQTKQSHTLFGVGPWSLGTAAAVHEYNM